MKATFAIACALLLMALALSAAEIAGVRMPDSTTVEGKTLKLNGAGLRKKMMFKVYVAGLYLENKSNAPLMVITSEQVKQMQLHVLRSLKAKQVTEAIEEGFQRNSESDLPKLKPRLERFDALFSDVKEGDVILLTYVPGKGTIVSIKDAEKGTIEGKDFADALFSVWLGRNPVQEDLKRDLLRG